MATFSPSPAPRRSTRPRPVVTSPPRRIRITGNSKPTSRLATPARFAHESPSIASGMDVDDSHSAFTDRSDTRPSVESIFAKSEELSASFYATLPVEVKQVLKNSDFYGDAYSGDIDTLTGFALVASAHTCFVWQHAQAVKGIPTCYIFSCPQDHSQGNPPFHGLIPYGHSREPGLILMSSSGEIRFWDSIGIGLAGGDHYSTTNLALSPTEEATNLIRADPQTYIVSTTFGTLFRLTLTSSGGKHHIASHPFSKPTSSLSFSRLLPSLFGTSSGNPNNMTPEPGNISSMALGEKTPDGGREIWALVETRVQKWDIKSEGWEEILLDREVAEMLRFAIRESFGESVEQDDSRMDLELVDLAIDSEGKLVVLVSYAGVERGSFSAMDLSGGRRIYALVRLSNLGEIFKVESVRSVPYQSTSSSGAPMHPRIQLVLGGPLISIQFGDAVALCARDSDYRDRLELKSATDRTLGVGVVQSDSMLLILTAAAMIKVHVDMEKVLSFDSESGQANLIKSTMMQAILYGALPENPLHFSFPPEVDEDSLMQGAEQLSQEILESNPDVVRKNHDLTVQLSERKDRLSWLIQFINDNVVLIKMSQRSRQKLATDAEKLYASHQLWVQHNDFLATAPTHSVLNDAVYAYMEEAGDDRHEDVMRAFFRLRVGDIGKLIRKVVHITKQASHETGHDVIEFLPEANRVVLTVLKSAFDYREYNLGVYGIDLPMINPWTSRPAIIDVVLDLFEATTISVESSSPDSTVRNVDIEPNSQLPELAAIFFACIQERLDWLGSAIAATEPGAERDGIALGQRFAVLRPEILETLRSNGHAGAAFSLAEKYRDFRSLVALCHKEIVYPPEKNPHASRIQSYLERFKDEFATELYRWYIQHGELRVMFAQEDTQGPHMEKFFHENNHPSISWIHDLGNGKHGGTAATLLLEAEQANNLKAKHLMLSIGKLAHLAQIHETDTKIEESVLDAFHDDLDFVSVHDALLQDFKSVLKAVRGKHSLESQIDTILKVKGSMLSDKKALAQIFKDLIRALLQGKALSIEDAVDVLTLKDNSSTVEDYATALHLLARVHNLPEARKISAFRTVWRRIYIHDDWDAIRKTANITDAELNERFERTALYATLCTILPREHQPEGYETLPDVALVTPSPSEIASRWPGLSQDDVEAIVQDYNVECDKLGDLDLNDVYYRVRELAEHNIVWQNV